LNSEPGPKIPVILSLYRVGLHAGRGEHLKPVVDAERVKITKKLCPAVFC